MEVIDIIENDKLEAGFVVSGCEPDVKNRAYINALGAEVLTKYLRQNGIQTSNMRNIHAIRKVLGEFDVADVMLENVHIDVRVVFDENCIFVPKSHFEYNLTPDIYVVFKMDEDAKSVNFMGFFTPRVIEDENCDETYYFVRKELLTPPEAFIPFIKGFEGDTATIVTEDETDYAETSMISMIDNDIDPADKKLLLKQLAKSSMLRDKFIEFENFEMLSVKALGGSEMVIEPEVQEIEPVVVEEPEIVDENPDIYPLNIVDDIMQESLDDLVVEDNEISELVQASELVFGAEEGVNEEVNKLALAPEMPELSVEPVFAVDPPDVYPNIEIAEEPAVVNEEFVVPEMPMLEPIEIVEPYELDEIEQVYDAAPELDFVEPVVEEPIPALESSDIYPPVIEEPDFAVEPPDLEVVPEIASLEQAFENVQAAMQYSEVVQPEEVQEFVKPQQDLFDELNNSELLDLIESLPEAQTQENLSVLYSEPEEKPEEQMVYGMQELARPAPPPRIVGKKRMIAAICVAAIATGSALYFGLKLRSVQAEFSEPDVPPAAALDHTPMAPMAAPESAVSPQLEPIEPVAAKPNANTISVQKIVWEVPEYLSYSPSFKDYLSSAGKSIKLSLSSDLLLATEYAYSKQIRVEVSFDRGGNVKDVKVAKGSGSAQIDSIVLQSVKGTLNAAKPPSDEIKGLGARVTIIITL